MLSTPPAYLSPSPLSLLPSSNCAISALRDAFEPFPFRPAGMGGLSFVTLGVAGGEVTRPGGGEGMGSEVVVRAMKRGDVEAVRRLQDDCLPVSYPSTFYTLLLTNPSSLCLVAYSLSDPSLLLGCISASITYPLSSSLSSSPPPPPPQIYILSLSVSPSFRSRGLASHLLRAVSRALLPRPVFHGFTQRVEVRLHVETENGKARGLYGKKMGMKEVGRVRGHYRRTGRGGSGEAVEMRGVLVV